MLERIEPTKDMITYKPKHPFVATVIKNERLLSDDNEDDTRHIVLDVSKSGITYVDGQSIGILTPGINEKQKPHKVRLYSIASCSEGDDGDKKTLSLCVKRANTKDENGVMHYGVCSNYLCDLKVGDEVACSGPNGKLLSMPKDDKNKLILLATGTGIAPFRGFLEKIYKHLHKWDGGIDLYFGAKTKEDAYYMNSINNELTQLIASNKDIDLRLKTAFSREDTNANGKRMYIQDLLKQDIKELFDTFEQGNFSLYVCGLKGIAYGIDEVFEEYAASKGLNWRDMKKEFKAQKRWNIEVY